MTNPPALTLATRINTTPGVHPYDEITWTYRTIIQTNWKTGEETFRQDNVEFPDFWSENAATITTTKYFRGAHGTPERETSLKHLIDRIVNTYTKAAQDHGYITTPEELETFNHELTYLLLHQYFAFNSPVWFNVGTSSPQQVSACQPYHSLIHTSEGVLPIGHLVENNKVGTKVLNADGSWAQILAVKNNGTKLVHQITFHTGETLEATADHLIWNATHNQFLTLDQFTVGDTVTHYNPDTQTTQILTITAITAQTPQTVYDIQTDTEEYLTGTGIRIHNCFILAVDDTMDSILNWYREEGLIFKGGSGAGVNISRIRSSKELLRSSGGSASGPVSFMRGADASAGTIKSGGACLAPWTKVYTTENGPVDVETLARNGNDFTVIAYNPLLKRMQACTARAWKSGYKQLVKLTTDKGVFTLSNDHPVLLKDGQYKPVGDLTPGMSIRPGTVTHNNLGYARIGLHDGAKGEEAIHRLVAQDVLGVNIDGMEVYHKDHNPANNAPANLEVLSRTDHIREHSLQAIEEGAHPFQKLYDEKGAAAAQHQKMLNTAYRIANNGGNIDTFESYVEGRKRLYGRIASVNQLREKINRRFGSYEKFLEEVRANNHTVVAVEPLHESVVYDVEVDNDTPRDKSPQDGHNFLIISETSSDNRKGHTGIIISNTRRAAKMIVLDVDHPDIEEFVELKAREEEKIRVLRDAGFDMDLGGKDIVSVQYQNANNSVRVNDEFMEAVEDDTEYGLKAVLTGETIETVQAKGLFRKMAEAAWACADPGIQYDGAIQHWHTNPETGRITASNPCFPGEQRISTTQGLIPIGEMVERAVAGEQFYVATNDVTRENENERTDQLVMTRPVRYMVTGQNDIVRLEFSDGSTVRCTPNHRFWTEAGWVEAKDLTSEDRVVKSYHRLDRSDASWNLPLDAQQIATGGRLKWATKATKGLPTKWDEDLAHLLGWFIGDGAFSAQCASFVYGNADDQKHVMPRHNLALQQLLGQPEPLHASTQPNGTMQLRSGMKQFHEFLIALGCKRVTAKDKEVPAAIFSAPEPIVGQFMRGLFDADGCLHMGKTKTRYAGLGSRSRTLLQGVQELLTSLGIASTIYHHERKVDKVDFTYVTVKGEQREYRSTKDSYDLRVKSGSLQRFKDVIGFTPGTQKAKKLDEILDSYTRGAQPIKTTVSLVSRVDDGKETTYNITEPRNHSYLIGGTVVANCSEFLSVDNSSCNLASLNLMKFRKEDGEFDIDLFVKVTELVITAMEISIAFADFPTKAITDVTRKFRQLGIGYSNLGALLMADGLPYDSPEGRAYAAALTSLMSAVSYRRSAEIAARVGAYQGYKRNKDAHIRVVGQHTDYATRLVKTVSGFGKPADYITDEYGVVVGENAKAVPLAEKAQKEWEESLLLGREHGWRNSQISLLAPTGCLVGGSLVNTSDGLLRLDELGDVWGSRWQDLSSVDSRGLSGTPAELKVATDEGPRTATQFFVNGEELTRRVETRFGSTIQGTLRHRIKVWDDVSGSAVWKHLMDVKPGDVAVFPRDVRSLLPAGSERCVPLPVLEPAYYNGSRGATAPVEVDETLAELVGLFMGDGSLHAKGLRFAVAKTDLDVVAHVERSVKELFALDVHKEDHGEYISMNVNSVAVAQWWKAAGFAKELPLQGHEGKGWRPHVPLALRETNNVGVWAAFLRGLFEADGTVSLLKGSGNPTLSSATESFVSDISVVMRACGFVPTVRKTVPSEKSNRLSKKPYWRVSLRNNTMVGEWRERVGFISARKNAMLVGEVKTAGKHDLVPVDVSYLRGLRDTETLPAEMRREAVRVLNSAMSRATHSDTLKSSGENVPGALRHAVSYTMLRDSTHLVSDENVQSWLEYVYEPVIANEDGGVQPTYDLSVPENVTYLANGFVSHNTISFLLDCDTTGVEPDFSLKKFKKLVGGSSVEIVNGMVPLGLKTLGYRPDTVSKIEAYVLENGHVVGAPGLDPKHYPVFDCAVGDRRAISAEGHVLMMAAVQPFLSGAISKCVTKETIIPSEDGLVRIGGLHRGESPDSYRQMMWQVASVDGPQKAEAFYYGGLRDVRRAVLRSGHSVTGTPNHRLLVATPEKAISAEGVDWVALKDLRVGDWVAQRYGTDMWSPVPYVFRGFVPSPSYGSQKVVTVPTEMSDELAFLLGAYVAEGHTSETTWSATFTNSDPAVLDRIASNVKSVFGFAPKVVYSNGYGDGRCGFVRVSSKTVVEFLRFMGVGDTSYQKRIPDCVLQSTRDHVRMFMQGLMLDGYTTWAGTAPKWALCVASNGLLDDVQAVLANFGIIHSRISKHNTEYDRDYDEVYASGVWAQRAVKLFGFAETHKRERAELVLQASPGKSTSDVVPAVTSEFLRNLIPAGVKNAEGVSLRSVYAYLNDSRSQFVTWDTVAKLHAEPGVVLPEWLNNIIVSNIHFSPVVSVEDVPQAEVYDISVPATEAFIGNGIVNHNTINVPESATVEDIEDVYFQGWKLGLKALAVYRDNCKVGQPLSSGDKKSNTVSSSDDSTSSSVEVRERVVERLVERPARRRLPKTRDARTTSFTVAGSEGYLTAGLYDDGTPGELFVKMSKQGSTLAGIMDAFSIALSLGLQYGVPLEAFVAKFTNMRFEPAGMTDDPDVRMAQSLLDYIFRRVALDFMSYEERSAHGIYTTAERTAALDGAARHELAEQEAVDIARGAVEVVSAGVSSDAESPVGSATGSGSVTGSVEPSAGSGHQLGQVTGGSALKSSTEHGFAMEAPLCSACGVPMVRTGACWACNSCGATSGCS